MGSEPAHQEAWKRFAWQAVRLTVPADWQLVLTGGSYASGYVQLADRSALRMELRWEPARGEQDPAVVVDRYVSKLRRRARKEGVELSVARDLKVASPPGKRVECYRWGGERRALAMLSLCEECERAVHVQLLEGKDGLPRSLGRTVFASLRDHSDGGWVPWRFLDVEFSAPAAMRLAAKSLQTGCIRMNLSERGRRLEFVRVSLAQVLLAEKGLEEWFGGFYGASLKRRRFRVSPAQFKGHQGLKLEGRAWLVVNPLALVGRRRIVRARCWHCEPSNRIFICRYDGLERGGDDFERAAEGFHCCDGES